MDKLPWRKQSKRIINSYRGDSDKFSFMVNVNDSEGDDELTGLLGYTWNNSKENVSTSEGASTKWKYPFVSFEEQIPKNK